MKAHLPTIEGPWPGKLIVLPRPRGGDWLEDEIAAWRAEGVGAVVSLLEKEEERDLDLSSEGRIVQEQGLQFLSFPIVDRSVPASRVEAREFIARVADILTEGSNVVIHCRGGLGRAPLIAASLLALVGVPPEIAFQEIGDARRITVPETGEQRQWVVDFAGQLAPVSPVPSC
jgi:protein-tyrosine phosphatase